MSDLVEDDEEELTRKQRREQARAQRKELEESEAADQHAPQAVHAARDRRGGGRGRDRRHPDRHRAAARKKASRRANTRSNQTVAEVSSLVGGIPQNGNVLGNPNAPVTLEYFGDLECPICKEFTLGALPSIDPAVGAHRQAEDRVPLDGDRDARTGSVQDPAGRGARGGQAAEAVVLHRALLPRAGRRELGLRHRKLPAAAGAAGAGAEPHEVDERPQRTRARQPGGSRRAGRQRCGLHRHALVPARQDRRHAAEVRTRLVHRTRRPTTRQSKRCCTARSQR